MRSLAPKDDTCVTDLSGILPYVYTLTIKKSGKHKYTMPSELTAHFTRLAMRAKTALSMGFRAYELDNLNTLHLHATIYTDSQNLKLFNYKGWSIRLDKCYDVDGWFDYLTKKACNWYEQEEILLLNESRNTNMFESI